MCHSLLVELRNDLTIHHEWFGSRNLSRLAIARLEGILLGRLVAKVTITTPATSTTATSTVIQPPFAGRARSLVRALGLMMAGGAGVRVVAVALMLGLGHFVRLSNAMLLTFQNQDGTTT